MIEGVFCFKLCVFFEEVEMVWVIDGLFVNFIGIVVEVKLEK